MRPTLLVLIVLLIAGCTGSQGSGGGATVPPTWVVSVEDVNGTVTAHTVTRASSDDADHDGVNDVTEFAQKTDPNDPDTDHDGLLDGHDVTLDPQSDLAKAWRARGIFERSPGVFAGEFDVVCQDGRHMNPTKASSDGDKLADGAELAGWNLTRTGAHVHSDPCTSDADHDGLPDDLEKALGTDPNNPDTDGDGAPDGADADPNWNLMLGIANVTFSGANATGARLVAAAGSLSAVATSQTRNLTLDVDDHSTSRASLPIATVLRATDASGRSLALFPDPRGVIVTFDMIKGTADGVATAHLDFAGADGGVSFDWSTVRV